MSCNPRQRHSESEVAQLSWPPCAGKDGNDIWARVVLAFASVKTRVAVDASFHGGKGKYDASPYVVAILARARRPTELSYFRFGVPLAWVAAHKPAAFTELVLDICKLLEPSSGYAGLAAIPHVNADRPDRGFEVALGFAARFRGLEIDLPGSHAI